MRLLSGLIGGFGGAGASLHAYPHPTRGRLPDHMPDLGEGAADCLDALSGKTPARFARTFRTR